MKPVNKLYKLWLAILIPCLFGSCKKYLDEKANKTLVVPATIADLQGMLDNDFYMNTSTSSFGQTSDDDYFMTPDTYNAVSDLDRYVYTWRPKDYTFGNDWGYDYTAVYVSNYCIDQLKKIDSAIQNRDQYNNVKGSAHFFRAYYFLNLLWEFGKAYDETSSEKDLGIVLRLGADFNVKSARATVMQSYQQIISDLKTANAYLPDNPIHPMRPSKAASYATLARTYLSMRMYDSAYVYADKALGIKHDILDYNSSEVDPSSPVPFQPYNKEIIFYTTQSGRYLPVFSFFSFADTALFNSYDSNDLRRQVFYFPQGNYYSFKGHYTANPYLFFSGITTAEMVLTRAECLARKGLVAEAMAALNNFLPNRWVAGTFQPLSASTKEEALAIVLAERRKELTMRSLRWIDIKRLNKEGANIILKRVLGTETYTLAPKSNYYALPIPKDIIDQTGITQN